MFTLTRINGIPACARRDTGQDYPLTHSEFLKWIQEQGKTLEQWLIENPYQPWGDMSLDEYKAKRIKELDDSIKAYIYDHYEQHRQATFTKLLIDARFANNTEAINYVNSCWTWINSVLGLYYSKAALINNAQDYQQVKDVDWSEELISFDASDPKITIERSLQLLAQ